MTLREGWVCDDDYDVTSARVTKYLATLPRGIDSYPEHCVRGSVVRAIALTFQSDREVRAALLPEIDRLLAEPPLVSVWLPEVHLNVLFSAICEVRHTLSPRASFEAWAYEGNRAILGGPFYRALFTVLGPERILARAQSRWSAFRRGTTLVPLDADHKGTRLRLDYPPHLMPDVGLWAMGAALRAAADVSGAKDVSVSIVEESASSTVFTVRWR